MQPFPSVHVYLCQTKFEQTRDPNPVINEQTTMIYVADSARKKIEEIKAREGWGDEYFLRVWVTSGGCSGLTYKMEFDNELRPEDQVFEDNGMKVVTDLRSVLYLFNSTLEFSGGLNGKGFFFNNPNASRTCGCGESFSV